MQEKDKISINYFEDAARIADLLNTYFYHGKQIIDKEDIKERKREISVQENTGKKRNVKTIIRDIVKETKLEAQLVMIALENQSGIHYAMPLRIMRGDSFDYQEQWNKIAKKHRENKDLKGNEFLSGFSKEDKLTPVITICIYLGEEPWDGPRCLKDMLNLQGISEEVCEQIVDYPLNLIEVNKFKDIEQFQTDLRVVFGFLQRREDSCALKAYMEENEKIFQNLPEDTYDFLSAFSNTKELEEMKKISEESEEYDMCKAIQDLIEQGRQDGIKQGEELGRGNGIKIALQVIHMNELGKNRADISEVCGLTVEKVEEILQETLNISDKG